MFFNSSRLLASTSKNSTSNLTQNNNKKDLKATKKANQRHQDYSSQSLPNGEKPNFGNNNNNTKKKKNQQHNNNYKTRNKKNITDFDTSIMTDDLKNLLLTPPTDSQNSKERKSNTKRSNSKKRSTSQKKSPNNTMITPSSSTANSPSNAARIATAIISSNPQQQHLPIQDQYHNPMVPFNYPHHMPLMHPGIYPMNGPQAQLAIPPLQGVTMPPPPPPHNFSPMSMPVNLNMNTAGLHPSYMPIQTPPIAPITLHPTTVNPLLAQPIHNNNYHHQTNNTVTSLSHNTTTRNTKNKSRKQHNFAGASFATDLPQAQSLPKPSFT